MPRPDWAYFLDIDGTLVEIANSPSDVLMDHDVRQLIASLHDWAAGGVAVISGRAILDIDRLFAGARYPAAGQHGVERRDAAGRLTRHAFPARRLTKARGELSAAIARHPGLWLEDKGLSIALHYRRAPRLAGYVHRLARSALGPLGSKFCLQGGHRVAEIKPSGRDKGMAVREFMQEVPFRGRVPIFIGDDRTDEYGFATVNQMRGHSVKVGSGPSVARWRLRDARAVRAWLARGVSPRAAS